MKKFLCCLFALLALISPVLAEPASETVHLTFEDGFSLSLPADWVSYAVDPSLADMGCIYCLGSADGARLMYIQRWKSEYDTLEALAASFEDRNEIELRSTNISESGESFLMYSFTDADASGGMLLLEDSILNLFFTPQSDDALMLTAAAVLSSLTVH